MFTAFQRFETLNYTATLEVLASKLGKIHSLPENAYHMSETNEHTKLDDFIPRSHTSEELAARRDMITLIHRSYKMGLFTATHGTYSACPTAASSLHPSASTVRIWRRMILSASRAA